MANKGAKSNGDGRSATKATGTAASPKGSSTRGFTPQGAKTASGPAIKRTGGNLTGGPKSGYGVQK